MPTKISISCQNTPYYVNFFSTAPTPLSLKTAIAAGDFVGWDFGWMEENKKSGGGFFIRFMPHVSPPIGVSLPQPILSEALWRG